MIRFDDVVFRYPYDSFDVLKGATFCLESGINTVLCDLQSGKTTICRLILGELQPTSGKISVFGNSPDEKNPAKNILYLPQKPVFFRNRSVLYNLQYPSRVRKNHPIRFTEILPRQKIVFVYPLGVGKAGRHFRRGRKAEKMVAFCMRGEFPTPPQRVKKTFLTR